MRSTLRRFGVFAVAATAALAVAVTPAQAEPATGSISGQLTSGGAPVSGFVNAVDSTTRNTVAGTFIDGTGHYTIANLPVGTYKLEFFAGLTGGLHQWAYQKQTFEEADTFTVVDGATTVVDEALPPTGSIGGTLSDASGPVAGVSVSAQPVGAGSSFGNATTDDQGRFELPLLLPTDYQVVFELSNGVRQYYAGQVDSNKATRVTVVANQRTAITETLLPTGSAEGRVVEDGAGVSGAGVSWVGADGLTSAFASTDADGRYAIPRLFPGDYRVGVRLPDGRTQWAHGKVGREEADLVSVAAGARTVVDEVILPTGQVRVHAVDALTGAPVASFCAEIRDMFACTEDGTATFAKVPAGRHVVTFFPQDDKYLGGATAAVEVTAGGTVDVTLRPTPAAVITTTVRDRATGAPVAGVCVAAITLKFARFPDGFNACSDEAGRVRLGSLQAGTYTLFAQPNDGTHGMQWVGPGGGTGNQLLARRLTVQAGQTVATAPILLDGAGTVSGRLTDKATGAPVTFGEVALLTNHPGAGPVGPTAFTDADGRYTFPNLGPYDWPLRFTGFGYAAQWSGGTPSRLVAKPVRVKAGKTTTVNVGLTKGTTLRGAVTVGGEPTIGFVVAYEAVTGDVAGAWGGGGSAETYDINLFGPTVVRIAVDTGEHQFWYRNAADFDHATPVVIPRSGTKTVDLRF